MGEFTPMNEYNGWVLGIGILILGLASLGLYLDKVRPLLRFIAKSAAYAVLAFFVVMIAFIGLWELMSAYPIAQVVLWSIFFAAAMMLAVFGPAYMRKRSRNPG